MKPIPPSPTQTRIKSLALRTSSFADGSSSLHLFHLSRLIGRIFVLLACSLAFASSPRAQETLVNGSQHTGAISPAGDADSWAFNATAGNGIMLRVGAASFAPKIQVFDPANALVTQISPLNSNTRDSFLTLQTASAGLYTVLVTAAFPSQTGNYTLSFAQAPGAITLSPDDQGGPLTNGILHTGSIPLGDLDVWSFTARAGDSLILRAASASFTPWIRLYSPTGELASEATSSNSNTRDTFLSLTAPATGDYTVVLGAVFAQSGNYVLNLAHAPAPIFVSPGDTGGPVANGALNPGALELGDLDVYSLAANAGDSLMIRVGAASFAPWIRLYGPDGALAAEQAPNNSNTRDSVLSFAPASAGDYTIVIGAVFAQSGTYSFTAVQAPAPITVSPGDDGGPLTNGILHTGSIPLGDLDLWSFSASAGDGLMLRLGAASFAPWIRVYAPNGALAGEIAPNNSNTRDAHLSLAAPAAGLYTVVIGAVFAQTGPYELTFAHAPAPIFVSPEDHGGPLTNGVLNVGAIRSGDLDLWSFNASEGEEIMVRAGSASFTPWIRIYGPNGAIAAEAAPNNANTRDTVLIHPIAAAGDYTLVLSAVFAQSGAYELTFIQATKPIVTSPDDHGGLLVNGATNNAALNVGDLDAWSFLGRPGDSNVFRATATSFTPWIRLLSPAGALVQEVRPSNSNLRSTTLSQVITNEGNYTVIVSAAFAQTGPYTFKQSRWAPDLIVPATVNLIEGESLDVFISAQDPDQPIKPLEFKLLSSPPGLNFNITTSTNARLTWTTTEADGPSTHTIVASVTDVIDNRAFIRTNEFIVNVREFNQAPVLSVPPDQTLDESTPLNLAASAADADLPPNALTFSLVAPPDGLTIDPATGAIAWTPAEAQGPSSHIITVVVTDNNPPAINETRISVTNQFSITVREINLPPQVVVTDQTVDELLPLTIQPLVTDPDLPANPISFELLNAPAGMNLNPATGAITWTPLEGQGPSTNVVQLRVTDNNPAAANTPQWTVTNNITIIVREVNSPPSIASQPDRTLDELGALTVVHAASDPDLPANNLSFALLSPPPGATISPTGTITWTTTEAHGGTTNHFTTVVTDDGIPPLNATNRFTVIVNEINEAPVLAAIPDASLHFDFPLSFQASATDADLPANTLVFSLESAPDGMAIDGGTGAVSWKPAQSQVGNYSVTVRVTDNGVPAKSDAKTFQIAVTGEGTSLSIQALAGGLMQLNIIGDIGLQYDVEISGDLSVWTRLIQFRLDRSPFSYVDTTTSSASVRFYRLRLIQE